MGSQKWIPSLCAVHPGSPPDNRTSSCKEMAVGSAAMGSNLLPPPWRPTFLICKVGTTRPD